MKTLPVIIIILLVGLLIVFKRVGGGAFYLYVVLGVLGIKLYKNTWQKRVRDHNCSGMAETVYFYIYTGDFLLISLFLCVSLSKKLTSMISRL